MLSPGGSRGLKVGPGNCRFKRVNFEEGLLCSFVDSPKNKAFASIPQKRIFSFL